VVQYANRIVRATRSWRDLYQGASPRAGITLLRGARVAAVLAGRDFVTPDDVHGICLPSLRHRVALTPESEVEGRDVDSVLNEVIDSIEVPRQ
jgi:MoxR-like ATPase